MHPGTWIRRKLPFVLQLDPLVLSAIVAFFFTLMDDPWWSITGAATSKLLTIQISPYYFRTAAVGISPTVPFASPLGSLTKILLFLSSVALAASVIRSRVWWRELALFFSLASLVELYLSFLLMYHAAQTTLLGAYGVLPPTSGSTHLPAIILGLDSIGHPNPLVTASLGLPFYIGFISIGLVGASIITGYIAKGKVAGRGVGALFSSEENASTGTEIETGH